MSRARACPIVLIVLLALLAGLGLTPVAATAGRGPEPPGRSGGNQQYFEVNSNADDNMAHDKNPGDCICEATLNGCTLRAAIEEANACSGNDTIAFHSSLQGTIIYLADSEGALPALWEAATVSAQSIWDSANDRPGLTLHGGSGAFAGLTLVADSCAVYGLYITAFQYAAVDVRSAYNYVGGPYVGQRNILSGNGTGVLAYGTGAHHNNVQGNWIGLDVTGNSTNPNTDGIGIDGGGHDNTIGGSMVEGNVISGNTENGVYIFRADTDGNRLGGNIIGLAADGSTPLGNGLRGVFISGGPENTVIGSPLDGNVIAGNQEDGILVQDTSSFWVQGNTINGNRGHGVCVYNTPNGQILANTIAYNSLDGVRIELPASTANLIVANSIHDSGGKGIALVNNGNGGLAAPTITGATPTRVEGTACAGCMVHIYSDSAGEGETYHGAANADGGGNWVYTGTIAGPNATATNTDSGNNTSEFSAPVVVGPPCTPVSGVTITGPATGVVYVPVCFTATVAPDNATEPISYLWAPGPGSGQGTPFVCYTWGTPGDKVITVTASNCSGAGTAQTTHTITIGEACVPVSDVAISGPTTGDPGVAVCFTATVTPGNVTEPIDYLWDPVPDNQGHAYVCYTWMNPGTYVFTVTASNCGGSAFDTHTVTIGGGSCVPVTGVTISGPTTGLVGITYGFQTTIAPANATLPIQYTWTPAPGSGQGTVAATYTWSAAGTYNVNVAVSNCGGAGLASDGHSITISAGTVYQVYLPVVEKHK